MSAYSASVPAIFEKKTFRDGFKKNPLESLKLIITCYAEKNATERNPTI